MPLIKILVAETIDEQRSNIRRLVNNQDDIRIVGEALTGQELIDKAMELKPHIVLVDINMPEIDGLKATEILAKEMPRIQTVVMSMDSSTEKYRAAMKAGAKDFLAKPFSEKELIDTIGSIYEKWLEGTPDFLKSQVARSISVYSTKGGVGRTTIAVNLATALAKMGKKTLLIDASLQFGDVAIMLNLSTKKTIGEIIEKNELTLDNIERSITHHPCGLDVLLAPRDPAVAETIKPSDLSKIFDIVAPLYQYIVFDMSSTITEKELVILDKVDVIFLVATLEITALKNAKICLKTFKDIKLETKKIKVILNKEIPNVGISSADLESGLSTQVYATVPMESEIAQRFQNKGESFILNAPNSKISKAITDIAYKIADTQQEQKKKPNALDKLIGLILGK